MNNKIDYFIPWRYTFILKLFIRKISQINILALMHPYTEKNGDQTNMNDYQKWGIIIKKEKRVFDSTGLIPKPHDQ